MIRSKGLYYVELLFFFAAVLLIKNESIFFSWETSDKLLHILPIVVFCLLVAVFQSIFIEKRLIRICFGFLFFAVISVITYHYYSMIQLRFLLTVVPTVFALLSYREAAFAEMNQTKKKSKQKNTRNNRWFCFFYAIATILCVWGFANCKKNSILFHFFPDYIKSAVLILLSFVIFLYLLLRSFAGSEKKTGRKKNSWNWNKNANPRRMLTAWYCLIAALYVKDALFSWQYASVSVYMYQWLFVAITLFGIGWPDAEMILSDIQQKMSVCFSHH